MVPFGMDPENAMRVHIVSFQNMVFGTIELIVFVITVRKTDLTFDKEHVQQLLGHTLPIAAALVGLSFVSRATLMPVATVEFIVVTGVFLVGSVMRVLAIFQLGVVGFKFDIAFRKEQRLKTSQLYKYMRHPTYTAMMLVILSYAITTHHLLVGSLGLLIAWFGFQFRISFEEKALEGQFGEEYLQYRTKTGMWFPKWGEGTRNPSANE